MTNRPSLFSAVRDLINENPSLTTNEISDRLCGQFKNDSPVWLKHAVHDYRLRLKKLKEPEYQI